MISLLRVMSTMAPIILCAATGCGSKAAPTGGEPAPAAMSVDEKVLAALDHYEPMFKVNAEGRVIRLRLTWKNLPLEVLAEIGKLTELGMIDFAGATLTDDGLAQLKNLQKLRALGLGNTSITDDGLVHLEKLSSLQWVWMSKNSFTQEAVDALKAARPDMNIYLH